MTRQLLVLPIAVLIACISVSPVYAEDKDDTDVSNGATTFDVQNSQNDASDDEHGTSIPGVQATPASNPGEPQPEVRYVPICLHGDPTVEDGGFGCPTGEQLPCGNGGHTYTVILIYPDNRPSESSTQCIEPSDPQPPTETAPIDIPGEVLSAFKKVELPASTINIQPPGGQTLVNFKTILSTPAARHQVTVHLDKVDIDVVLEVWPSHFLWKHGDDTGQESTIAGAVWSEGADVDGADFITHVYTKKLTAAQVSVDTTWSAQFKGPKDTEWRAVNGTVTKVGEPVSLAVREATPQLVTDPN